MKEIEGAIELDPERGLTYSNLAVLRLAQGQKDQALAAYQKAVEVDPRSIIAWLSLANFQWSAGDVGAAETSLKRALEVDSKHVLANNALAVLYMSSRRIAEAEPYLKTIADSGIPEAAFQLADYYIGARRYDDAVGVLQPLTKAARHLRRGGTAACGDRLCAERQTARTQPGGRCHQTRSRQFHCPPAEGQFPAGRKQAP